MMQTCSIKTDKNNIVLAQDSGIANRIFFMASAIRIFDIKEFNLYWPNKGWVSDSFSNLFDFNWDYKITEYNEPILDRNLFSPDDIPLYYTEGWRLYITENDGLPKGFAYLYRDTHHGYSIDLEYNRIPEKIKNIYCPFFAKLKPAVNVDRRILSSDINIDNKTVAVQVRNNSDWALHKRIIRLDEFFKYIDKYPKDTKFYLSCMSAGDLNIFIERYGERILYLPEKNYNSMQDAVADLYLLSYCKEMIVSYESTFPSLAWYLGGADAKVSIVGLPPLIKRKIRKIKNYINLIVK